ncbi:thiamine-phosphate synthase [Clostridium tetani]|uniref:thiamine phosphate synthase n=1 Tax=Clostridium tetani TaxID=1513 RepID=UPI000D1FEE16|nr:thiamine phosphate synthase [Clostridium tetani]AVP54286.1 thiamine phosphate synthase [Clostridium tetani]RXI45852.1 thiamine phosphate synthase [Clostridium tetani]RXI73097.1 thiamine phosphate synthase [Clostridium tetani]RXI76188.1 thiamine phosphate synthase [Clostridium tetani]RXM61244.1 thiamine phosphate synthase [Clostridium tetani]
MHNKNLDCTLYLVTDRDILKGRDLKKVLEEAILGGTTLVQLREKNVSSKEFYEIAKDIKVITDKYNIPLIINDRVDIALAVNAEGIHIGQKDLPANIVRKIIGEDKILGVSANTIEDALKAQRDGADYLGVGAIFPTNSKKDAESTSIETLKEIKNAVNIPIVAIGGINENNVQKLKETNIDGIAVISTILEKEDVKKACEELTGFFNE